MGEKITKPQDNKWHSSFPGIQTKEEETIKLWEGIKEAVKFELVYKRLAGLGEMAQAF